MCNECGNCRSFCQYAGAPYKDKFTLFANEEDMKDSINNGFTVLDAKNKEIKIEFIPIDEREFKEINYDISDINSKEELIEKLQELKLNKNDFYKIILNGKRNFEINILEINKLIQNIYIFLV